MLFNLICFPISGSNGLDHLPMLRATAGAAKCVLAIVIMSVCPSVCPHVRKFRTAGLGDSLEPGHQRGVPPKNLYFTTISSSSVRTVADKHRLLLITRSTADKLSGVPTSMTLKDLEPQNMVFSEFVAISGCDAHLKSEF